MTDVGAIEMSKQPWHPDTAQGTDHDRDDDELHQRDSLSHDTFPEVPHDRDERRENVIERVQ